MSDDPDGLTVDRHLVVTQRLRARRLQLGLTQKQVVTRLALRGIRTTNKTLSSFEHGAGVDVVRLPELAAVLDCTVTYLLGLTDDPSSWEPTQPGRPASTPPAGPAAGNWILGPDLPANRARQL
jgi:hypothetical protein